MRKYAAIVCLFFFSNTLHFGGIDSLLDLVVDPRKLTRPELELYLADSILDKYSMIYADGGYEVVDGIADVMFVGYRNDTSYWVNAMFSRKGLLFIDEWPAFQYSIDSVNYDGGAVINHYVLGLSYSIPDAKNRRHAFVYIMYEPFWLDTLSEKFDESMATELSKDTVYVSY